MRTHEVGDIKIEYPDELGFVFNPQNIIVTNATYLRLNILDTYSLKGYYDFRTSYNGKVMVDISEYLKALFNVGNDQFVGIKNISVKIDTNGGSFVFTMKCIWGAMNIGEVFNPSRTVVMFRNFPSTISLFSKGGIQTRYDGEAYAPISADSGLVHYDFSEYFANAKDFGMIKMLNTPEDPSSFQFTFDRTFKPIPEDAVFIKVIFNDCDKGIYLRWLDRHGFLQYWLFQEGDSTWQSANNGEKLNVDYSDGKYSYYGMERYQGKTYQTTRKACAVLVDRDIFSMLSTIHSSPIVDMYIDGNWIPINIVAGSFTDSGADLKDFEIQITMPETITQIL